MKILRKSIINPQTCECCQTVFQLKHKDLCVGNRSGYRYDTFIFWKCKMCGHKNEIVYRAGNFKKASEEEILR